MITTTSHDIPPRTGADAGARAGGAMAPGMNSAGEVVCSSRSSTGVRAIGRAAAAAMCAADRLRDELDGVVVAVHPSTVDPFVDSTVGGATSTQASGWSDE